MSGIPQSIPPAEPEPAVPGGELDDQALRAIAWLTLAAAVLCALTILVFTQMPRHAESGVDVLANADFRAGFEGWDINGIVTLDELEVGHATLQNRNPDETVYLRQAVMLPIGHTTLDLEADVATTKVVPGESRARAKVYVRELDRAGLPGPRRPVAVVDLIGTAERHQVTRRIAVPASAAGVLLGIELDHATGQLEVAGLKLEALPELPPFRLAATLLVAAWCVLVVYVGLRVLQGIASPKLRLVTLSVGMLALAATLVPWTFREQMIGNLLDGFGLALDPDKAAHALVFALLALLVRAGRRHDQLPIHLSCWFLVAAATEVLQLLTVDRDPEAVSWLADILGVVIGLLVAEVLIRVDHYVTRSRSSEPEPDGPPLQP